MDTRLAEEEPELRSKPEFGFGGFEETEERFLGCFIYFERFIGNK